MKVSTDNSAPPLSQQIALLLEHTHTLEREYRTLREELRFAHLSLEHTHTTLQALLSHLSDGLLFLHPDGKIIHYNQAAALLTGTPREEALGSSFWDIFCDNLFGFSLKESLSTHRAPHQLLLTLSNGKELAVTTSWIPPDRGLLLLLHDRTALVQLERSVQQQERCAALGEMAAALAHEIRNPLGGIEGFASLLRRESGDPDAQRMLDAILEGSRTLNALVTHVLEYARPLTLHFVPTSMTSFLQETARFAEACGYPCTLSLDAEVCLSIDPPRLKLALLNLLKNAHEAGASTVALLLTQEGKLLIEDDGPGIDPEIQKKLFTPFFTTKAKGTGLGLAEVMKVVRAHGGELSLSSTPGKGTSITLLLSPQPGRGVWS